MSFILYSEFFDITISILIILNVISTLIISSKDFKQDLIKNDKNSDKLTKLEIFKLITIIVCIILIAIIILILSQKYNITSYLTLIYYLSFVFVATKLYKKNITDLTSENKISYIQTTLLFLFFFSNNASQIYLNTPLDITHTIKEYLLLTFLSIKIIFFIFCLIINLSILASNIAILFTNIFKKIKNIFNKLINKTFELQFYYFYLSKKFSKKLFILDIIIYIILCPFSLIIYLIFALLVLSMRFILKNILKLCSKLINYFDNSSKIISKTLKIATIMSLLIVYIIATYNPNKIFDTTKDIYNLFITVILIPLIYDSIKSK